MTGDWASDIDLGRDLALAEYQQQLWRTLRTVKNCQDRRRVLGELERLNLHGRAVLYTDGTAE